MSSSCSSTDLGIDTDFDDVLSESLIADIEAFVEHVHRLRRALDINTLSPDECDCETKCVQVHAALSMVSQAVRELLIKHPQFQTTNVFIPTTQLVHSVKGINFDSAKFDASQSLQAIERLEAAIGNALRRFMNQRLFAVEPRRNAVARGAVLGARSQSQSRSTSRHYLVSSFTPLEQPIQNNAKIMATTVIAPASLDDELSPKSNQQQHLQHSGSSGASHASSSTASDFTPADLPAMVSDTTRVANSTMGRRADQRAALAAGTRTQPLATKQPHAPSAAAASKAASSSAAPRLVRRHSTYQPSANKIAVFDSENGFGHGPSSSNLNRNDVELLNGGFETTSAKRMDADEVTAAAVQMRAILGAHDNGMEMAFERCKAWSKYAAQLIMFVRARLALEQDHARNAHKLAEHTRATLLADAADNHLPLSSLFEELMDGTNQFATRANRLVANLNQRFIATFENRQKEHDARRRKLKSTWTKHKKQYDSCVEELRRARHTLNSKEGGYVKARDSALRHELAIATPSDAMGVAAGVTPSTGASFSSASSSSMALAGTNGHGGSVSNNNNNNGQNGVPAFDAQHKKLKELEKKRRNEEEALNRKTDAENEVWRLERELELRRIALTELRLEIIGELCDLIRQCDLTTIACATHYFKAFSELWAPVPEEYNRLAAYAIRESSPSVDYMSFLQSQHVSSTQQQKSNTHNNNNNTTQPHAKNSQPKQKQQHLQMPSHSVTIATLEDAAAARSTPANCAQRKGSCDERTRLPYSTSAPATAGAAVTIAPAFRHVGRQTTSDAASPSASEHRPRFVAQTSADACATSSSSAASRRRNALNVDELRAETAAIQQQRRQKRSVSRLFEQSSSTSFFIDTASDAARSHQLQRTRQVTKCAHCEHLIIFDALKCNACGVVWHKKCLASVTVTCGPSARRLTEAADAARRRMSIFGVPLDGHLAAQQRRIPLILERCVDELQRRGMTCKGLYRTCGVKSKIEQICTLFEQTPPGESVDLGGVHAMNLASVVKLYLRRLPEPLLTYELYNDWLQFSPNCAPDEAIAQLRELVSRLPQPNYDTLKFLILHLKRVTWFELENLMTAANLAAVIAPSLIWAAAPPAAPAAPTKTPMLARAKFSCASMSTAGLNGHTQATKAAGCSMPVICSSTSFITDAHQQTKVVELMVQNAYDVFLEDKSTDWDEFFELYPGVEKPQIIEDAEAEACIAKKADVELRKRRRAGAARVSEDDDIADEEEEEEDIEDDDDDDDLAGHFVPSVGSNVASAQFTTKSRDPCRRSPSAPAHVTTVAASAGIVAANGDDSTTAAATASKRSTTSSSGDLPPAPASASASRIGRARGVGFVGGGTPKPRSFTTSILVSPHADRKFAAILASHRNNSSADYDADHGSRNSSEDNDGCAGAAPAPTLLLASRKWSETARSYQRLAPSGAGDRNAANASGASRYDESSDSDAVAAASGMTSALSGRNGGERVAGDARQRTLCSGEVVVDIKKEQYCLPNKPNRNSRVSKAGIPLSSASFNTVTTVPSSWNEDQVGQEGGAHGEDQDRKRDKSSERERANSETPRPKISVPSSLMYGTTRQMPGDATLTSENASPGALRRKRLERAAAHHFGGGMSPSLSSGMGTARAFSPAGNYAYVGDGDVPPTTSSLEVREDHVEMQTQKELWPHASQDSVRHSKYSHSSSASSAAATRNSVAHQPQFSYGNGGDGASSTMRNTATVNIGNVGGVAALRHSNNDAAATSRLRVDSRLHSAVGVLFSGSDVSYV